LDIVNKIAGLCFVVKIKGDLSMFIYLAMIDSPEEKLKFEIIYERYKGLMFYTANSVLGDTRDSEDIVHDAFFKIIEIIDEIDDPKSPQTRYLIVTITENKAIDLYRKRKAKTVVLCYTLLGKQPFVLSVNSRLAMLS
jgi:DNA-directed RNA polymerase specialized sigma24 family protein